VNRRGNTKDTCNFRTSRSQIDNHRDEISLMSPNRKLSANFLNCN